MKIFANKKILLTTIVLCLIVISSFFIIYLSVSDQSKINKSDEIDYSKQPEGLSPEIYYSQQIFEKCEYDMHCVTEFLTNLTKENEKPVVMATLENTITLYHEKQVNARCHSIAHHLGEWVYGYTKNLDESFQYADPLSCGGGLYHGIFSNYFSILNFEDAMAEQVEVKHLCNGIEDNFYSLDMAHCLHGIGHGLLLLYDYDVFAAVQRCEEFNTNLEQNSCANGIFMQNVLKNFETDEGQFDQEDILFPCNEIKSHFTPTCYIWQGPYILKQRDFEVYSSFRECDNIIQEFIKYCYYGIGAELETDAAGKMELALRFCQAGEKLDYHKYCFRGMAMKTSMVYLDSGFKFCSLAPEESKEECYDGLGYWIKLRHDSDEKRKRECSKAENTQYFEICMNAKIEGINYL